MAKRPGKIRAALIDWLGKPFGLATSAFWQEWNGVSSSGKTVTEQKALQLSTVWACIRLLSETTSTLPLKLYKRDSTGARVLAKDLPLYRLICHSPNSEMTPARFMGFVVACLCIRGNAYIEKFRINGRIVALVPLLPQLVSISRNKSGRLEYRYTHEGKTRVLSDKDLIHIRGFGIDGVSGMYPLTAGAEVIGSALSADEASGKMFANGLQSSGFLMHENGTLNEPQRASIRKSLQNFMGSQNAGKVMVLEAGLKYQGITMDPEKAQMLETRSFNVEEICRWFRVPPVLVGHMDKQSSWASSVEGMNLHFLIHSLRPLLENIEQELNRGLGLNANELFVKFNVEGLLRADSKTRSEFYNSAANNGWMTRNEIREKENLPPVEGGDKLTVQTALTPIENLGASPE